MRELDPNFRGGKHGYANVAMGKQQYILYSNISFIPPIKPGRTLAYPLNPTHRDIAVIDWQYQHNVYDYNLVKNMNSTLNKIVVADMEK